ncbi:MAG: hypothetical protein ACREL3_13215 [Gemmatimonadales bacterium]
MNTSRITFALFALTLFAASSSEAAAQWAVTAEVAAPRFWGGSYESRGGNRSFHPYRPTLLGAGVERAGRVAGLGLRGYYARASLALEGSDAIIALKHALEVLGAVAEVSVGLKRLDQRVRLVAYSGPFIEVWSLGGQSSHTSAGWNASVGLELSIGGRWSGVFRAGGGVSASPFSLDDLEAGFEPGALWRRELSGRIRFALGSTAPAN